MTKQKSCTNVLLFLMCFAFINVLNAQIRDTISINSNWELQSTMDLTPPDASVLAQKIPKGNINTQLPNALFNILKENGVIVENISPKNLPRLQWLKQKDWLFQRHFDIDEFGFDANQINLTIKGVDTYAQVFVNGILVFNTDDVSKKWSDDIKPHLKLKGNLLSIYFAAKYNTALSSQKEKEAIHNNFAQSPGIQSVDLHFVYGLENKEKDAQTSPVIVISKSIEQSKQAVDNNKPVIVVSKSVEQSKQAVDNNTPPVIVLPKSVEPPKQDVVSNLNTHTKTIYANQNTIKDVTWQYNIEDNMFKLTVKNDRSMKATGYFFLDVLDGKGNQLYVDMRFMSAESGSSVEFYKQNLKTFLQGQPLEDIEIVLRWRDEAQKPQELKKTFHLMDSKNVSIK